MILPRRQQKELLKSVIGLDESAKQVRKIMEMFEGANCYFKDGGVSGKA